MFYFQGHCVIWMNLSKENTLHLINMKLIFIILHSHDLTQYKHFIHISYINNSLFNKEVKEKGHIMVLKFHSKYSRME